MESYGQLAATLAAALGIVKAAKHQSWQSTMVGSTQKICELMKEVKLGFQSCCLMIMEIQILKFSGVISSEWNT